MWVGKNCRSLKNEWINAWANGPVEPLSMPLQFLVSQPALMDAKPDVPRIQPVMVGQVSGLLNEIKPARQVVEDMANQATEVLSRIA